MTRIDGRAPDGKGGINEMAVDAEGRADVRAIVEDDFAHSVDEGVGYTLHSTYSLTGGEEALSIRNDGANVHIDRVVVSTSASGVVSVMRMTSGTPAGTTITGKNAFAGDPIMPDITAFGNASVTGSVVGDTIDAQDVGTTDPYTFNLDGYTLPTTEVMFVRFDTNGVVFVTVYLHRIPE